MSDWLSIAVTFPTGRYHGKEWPPAPARLFQALLAGVMTGRYREQWDSARPVLELLERQPPPLIVACDALSLQRYRISVPNNDLDVAAREWRKGRPYNSASLRTLKTIATMDIECDKGPHVRYLWRTDRQHDWSGALTALADCMHTLGWGVDMAYAETRLMSENDVEVVTGERWIPAESSTGTLKIPTEGSLSDLCSAYERFKNRMGTSGIDPDTRGSIYGLQGYARDGTSVAPCVAFDLLNAVTGKPLAYDGRALKVVAAWLRHAVAEALREEQWDSAFIKRYVHGHEDDLVTGQHLSFVPLPSAVGHDHLDGCIRRALVVEPPGSDSRAVKLLSIKLAGRVIQGESGRCQIAERKRGDRVLEHYYLGEARTWRSVTPVVLHGYNSSHGKIAVNKTEKLVTRAFESAGYPARIIERIAFQQAPLWLGAESAGAVSPPAHLKKFPRYQVEVRFRRAVRGPVLAGLGRHCGLGIFAAWQD